MKGKTACHINHSDAGFYFHFLFERLFCPLFWFYSCILSLSLFSLNGIIPVSFLLQIHFHSLHLFKVLAGEIAMTWEMWLWKSVTSHSGTSVSCVGGHGKSCEIGEKWKLDTFGSYFDSTFAFSMTQEVPMLPPPPLIEDKNERVRAWWSNGDISFFIPPSLLKGSFMTQVREMFGRIVCFIRGWYSWERLPRMFRCVWYGSWCNHTTCTAWGLTEGEKNIYFIFLFFSSSSAGGL